MADLHIVTATLVAANPGNVAATDVATEGGTVDTPFIALLDEHMEADAVAQAVECVLREEVADDKLPRDAKSDPASDTAAAGLVPPGAFVPAERTETAVSTPATTAAHGARRSGDPRRTNVAPAAADDSTHRKTSRDPGVDAASSSAALRAAGTASVAVAAHTPVIADGAGVTVREAVTPAHGAAGSTHAGTAATPSPTVTLQHQVGSERWNNELGRNVQMFIHAEQHSATLRVTPAELGPVDVRIDMSGDQATVSFTVQHADTRLALENALPRLRDMLADGGILLGQAHVNQDSRGRHDAPAGSARGRHSDTDATPAIGGASRPAGTTRAIGMVDTFA